MKENAAQKKARESEKKSGPAPGISPRKILLFLLEKEIGISEDALGAETIDKAVCRRMTACGCGSTGHYLDYIHAHPAELQELVELTVVPETWFFRNKAAFRFLEKYAEKFRKSDTDGSILRVLSIPCSGGEEVWSLVISLTESGIPESLYHIDAVDVSRKALARARSGIYGEESFREVLPQREIYFARSGTQFQVRPSLYSSVRFMQGNLLDEDLLKEEKPYHIIFCRNLLIYLSAAAKNRAAGNIERLLHPEGLLFLGHAEQSPFRHSGFERISPSGAFVWRKSPAGAGDPSPMRPPRSYAPPPERKTEKAPPLPKSQAAPLPDALPPAEKEVPSAAAECEQKASLEKARCLADRGKLDEAFVLCKISLEENPTDAEAYFLMGMIYHAVGNEKETENYMNKVIYLDPAHCDALEQLWLIAEHRGDRQRAEHLRKRIRRILAKEEIL